jgi:hypothetical protein
VSVRQHLEGDDEGKFDQNPSLRFTRFSELLRIVGETRIKLNKLVCELLRES